MQVDWDTRECLVNKRARPTLHPALSRTEREGGYLGLIMWPCRSAARCLDDDRMMVVNTERKRRETAKECCSGPSGRASPMPGKGDDSRVPSVIEKGSLQRIKRPLEIISVLTKLILK